ncbi:repressor LexA [Candidatus Sumerlaeota bacterium]|nr:repressor LexA [Candidatus Sumerlaeota bacterium]
MIGLSRRQSDTLREIFLFNENNGYFPSVRDLCSAMKIASTNTIQTHLKGLERKEYLERHGSGARALRLTQKAWDEREKLLGRRGIKAVRGAVQVTGGVPLFDTAPAGTFAEAFERSEGYIQLGDLLPINDATYALAAHGDSMVNKGIHDGDTLIVRHQTIAESGDVIVALLNGEPIVRSYIQRVDGVTLQPANDFMEPARISLDHEGLQICGKVVGVIHGL